MLLRRTFPLPPDGSGGGGGALAVTVTFDPLEKYNPIASGNSQATQYATASGGTPPYTYAWARQSGSTDIGGGGGSDANTTFSALGSTAPQTTVSAVWRITVTDDNSDTAFADFDINFYFGMEAP